MSAAKQKYKPYPKYKDSGVDWLGRVPEHWSIVPFFGEVKLCKRSNQGMIDDNLLSLSFGRIIRKDINTGDGLLPASFETYQIVEEGDEIFRFTDLQNDHRSLRSARVVERGIITSAYLAVTPKFKECSYFSHLMRSYDTTKVFYSMGGGLRQSLKFDDVRRLPIISPPPAEQTAIADFIERECGRMDKLVEKKQQFIALLKEKRQALITHAVTKGLNPKAKMKDSGVEWLGMVPEHWEVKKVKYLVRLQSGDFITSDSIQESGSYLVYGGNGKRGYTDQFTHEGEYLLIGRQGALCGNINYASGKFWASEHAVVGNPITTFDIFWLGELLRAMNLNQYSVSAAQPGLAVDRIASLPIPVPPDNEQISISNHLKQENARIDRLLAKTEKSIDLLKERKTALITAAVTGQIDVSQSA
jgi:type I restriction enzyme S subunit